MKASFFLLVISFLGFSISCSQPIENDEMEITNSINNPINLDSALKVLILGNSFSVDVTDYLNEIVENAGINQFQLAVYNGVKNGGALKDWINRYNSDYTVNLNRVTGKIDMLSNHNLRTILNQDWDIVVLLEVSSKSFDWDTFKEDMPVLIGLVKKQCTNNQVQIAYQIPWGHTLNSTPSELKGNIYCARKAIEELGVNLIVPVGVAIQNVRNTYLNNDAYLTRDNWHLAPGVGKYVAACTFYESIIAPLSHVGIVGTKPIHELDNQEKSSKGSVTVDDSNCLLCQKCAYYAVKDTFTVRTAIP